MLTAKSAGHGAEQEHRKKNPPHVAPVHARGFITAKCIQNGVDYWLIQKKQIIAGTSHLCVKVR
jgi:hypothetical protein